MDLNTEPIKNWFGFTRRERRSTFTLLVIIILILGLRYTIPDSTIAIDDLSGITSALENRSSSPRNDNSFDGKHYSSETNKPSGGKQMKSGNTSKTAFNPGSYRNKAVKSGQQLSGSHKSIIDINTSDSAMLVRLPGIGPVLSARIIKYRHLLGGYARIGQLKEVYGLHEDTFEMIKNRISADSTVVKKININSADYKELLHFPYFEKYEVSAILKYREIKVRINGINDLINNKLITAEKASKISPYLNFK
jgi:DNA uptake protein ComE-like DNA-binding protein